ncbi:MAG TPA: DNA-3-methyladenine glycosylase [candidate division Zixibacteria bacterium]|nr:DNA-3-methyladenine glycosylase [candidate division Zixibacteria bacterium]
MEHHTVNPQLLRKRIAREFFDRDPREVAPELLGKLLVRRQGRTLLAGRIVEIEAYLGEGDPAAHAYSGRTPRNAVLFGPAGHAYIYFIYGMHFCANISCMKEGEAGGVLLRALEPIVGVAEMAESRGLVLGEHPSVVKLRQIASGPGRLCQALGITRERDNGKDLCGAKSDLWVADDDHEPARVISTPRIGIRKAVDEPLRYFIAENRYVSGAK